MAENNVKTAFDDEEIVQLMKGGHENHTVPPLRVKFITASRIYIVIIHLFAIFLLLRLSAKSNMNMNICKDTLLGETSWSPVHEFLEFEINSEHATEHTKHSKFSGTPHHAQDTAWDDLIRPMFFNASLEELQRGGETIKNLAVVEGGGYAATIGVYHELHCLRQLRFYVFQNRYYPSLTQAQENYLRGHLDHCIETLRLTIMCYGNPSLVSFAWGGKDATKPLTQSNSRSVCVKWDTVDSWARSRAPRHYALAEEQPGFKSPRHIVT
ncbi:hypothetical protein F5Y14DRAFT_460479 [Nemania sp. NC0429]|nr:hypothetical protein F5Y14DRAFT_460479 [Nemania sp. NC0429]